MKKETREMSINFMKENPNDVGLIALALCGLNNKSLYKSEDGKAIFIKADTIIDLMFTGDTDKITAPVVSYDEEAEGLVIEQRPIKEILMDRLMKDFMKDPKEGIESLAKMFGNMPLVRD